MMRRAWQKRRGTIFLTAMWVMIILGGLVLVFARSMRVEIADSGNQVARAKASAIELGAEQYVIGEIANATPGDAAYITSLPAEGLQVGDGYFWILQPHPDYPQNYYYGMTDEASKVNLNAAGVNEMLFLPGMTQEAADSIVDWRDSDENVTDLGAESSYYMGLPEPYQCKNKNFETLEELYLVKPWAAPDPAQRQAAEQILWGYDKNHNGIIDPSELSQGGMSAQFNAASATGLGIAPLITVYSVEPNTDSNGKQRTNVNGTQTAPSTTGAKTTVTAPAGGPNNDQALRTALQNAGIAASRVTQIVSQADQARRRGPFANIFDFAQKVNMTAAELDQAGDELTTATGQTNTGLINVNTASKAVLLTLQGLGLTENDADSIINARTGSQGTGYSWFANAITMKKAAAIGARITTKSYVYSADIVAMTGDGRAYKRVKIVVDATQSPPRIVYRKDITQLGFPLPRELRDSLRNGQGIPASYQGSIDKPAQSTSSTASGSGSGNKTSSTGTR